MKGMDMDVTIPPDRNELPLVDDDEVERLLALEIACTCFVAHAERLEQSECMDSAALRAA
jgi:hypothetical protein